MKKSALFAGVIALGVVSNSVFASGTLQINSVNFATPDNYYAYTTEDTEIRIGSGVQNNSSEKADGILIYAVYKEEDMSLVSVKTRPVIGIEAGKTKGFSETVYVPDKQGYIVSLYLWDNEESGISLSQTYAIYDRMIIPPAPVMVTQGTLGYTDVALSWLTPNHNLGIVRYYIYCNGEKVGESTTNSFKINSLAYGQEFDIEVAALDAAGSVSSRSNAIKAKTLPAAYMILGATNEYYLFGKDMLIDQEMGSFYSEVVTVGPENDRRECRKIQFIKPYNGNNDGLANYLMFDVDNQYIKPTDSEITIKVTCLDEGLDKVAIDYSTKTNNYTNTFFNKTDSGKWKTFTVHISDAELNDRQANSQYDFRISTGESNTVEYIHKVEVFKGYVN